MGSSHRREGARPWVGVGGMAIAVKNRPRRIGVLCAVTLVAWAPPGCANKPADARNVQAADEFCQRPLVERSCLRVFLHPRVAEVGPQKFLHFRILRIPEAPVDDLILFL